MSPKSKEFITKLQKLMKEYNVEFDVQDNSDSWISSPTLEMDFNDPETGYESIDVGTYFDADSDIE